MRPLARMCWTWIVEGIILVAVLTLATWFAGQGTVDAGECAVVQKQVVVKQQVGYGYVQKQQHYARAVVLKQVYPAYYYGAAAQLQYRAQARIDAEEQAKAFSKLFDDKLRQMEQRLRQESGGEMRPVSPETPPEPREPLGLQIMRSNAAGCVACHTKGSKPVVEDDAPVYFDDKSEIVSLDTGEAEVFLKAIFDGRMPKGTDADGNKRQPVSDEDYLAIKEYVKSITSPARNSMARAVER